MGKSNRKKRSIIIPLGIILALVFGFLIYNTVSYPPDETAKASLGSDENVIVARTDYGYFFDGPSEENLYIFYPGAKVDEVAYAPLMHRLAAEGMDTCLVHMPFRFALYDKNKADDILPKYQSYRNVYIGGHSLGGATAAIYASEHGDILAGVILLAAYPTKTLPDSLIEISIYGSDDGVLNFEKLEDDRKYAPVTNYEFEIQGGNHAGFGNYGPQHGDLSASITKEEQQIQTADFILSHLSDLSYEANATKEADSMKNNTSEPEYDMTPTAVAVITLPDRSFSIDFENNDSANALWDSLKSDYLKITLTSSGENKKVGELPYDLPFAAEEITTEAGDVILTEGNKIEFLYGEENITGRKIGNIYATSEIMGEYFGREGSVDAELYLEWTE